LKDFPGGGPNYAAEGQSDVEIAARRDTSSGIVGRWRRRF
jgi:hypothetical protein